QRRHAAQHQGDGRAADAERRQGNGIRSDGDVHGPQHLGRATDPRDDDRGARRGGLDEPDRDHLHVDHRDGHRHARRGDRDETPPPVLSPNAFRRSSGRGDRVIRDVLSAISLWAIPVMLVGIPLIGIIRKVKVYDAFVDGAKDGFDVAVRIIPFLVGILVAIGMFRGSGAMDLLTNALKPVMNAVGFPAELLPLAILRTLTGSGSLAFTTDLVKTYGPDSLIGRMAATMYGSSETTFYVLAVYFGAVGVKRTRHAVPAALIGDVVAAIATVAVCAWMFS